MTATGDLYEAWYDAVTAAFGLSPLTFLMSRSLIPLGSTSAGLWDYFDSVPPESGGHYYDPSFLNRFSDGYGVVVNLVIPQSGTVWREAVGDQYSDWARYLASSPTIPPGGMLELFTAWAWKNIPDPERAQKAITAYEQILNGVVPVAQDRFIKAGGVYAYSRSIAEAKELASRGARYDFSFSSDPPAGATRSLGAAAFAAKLASVGLRGEVRGPAAAAVAKLAASHVKGHAVFDHQALVWASPLQGQKTIGDREYPAWFSAAALKYARDHPDATVWPADMKPTWEQTFGPSGNLRRLVTNVVLVDGVDVVLSSDAAFSSDERSALQQAAAAGVTPLFAVAAVAAVAASAEQTAAGLPAAPALSLSFGTDGIHIQSPLGVVMLFGVVVAPAE